MRGDKTFARILLIFSIAHVVIAAPAVVRQRSLVRGVPDSGSTDESALSLRTASDVSETPLPPSQAASLHEPRAGSEQDPAPGSPLAAGSSHQDGVPATPPPPPASEHQDWTPSHGSLSDVPLSQDLAPSHDAMSRIQPPQWKLVQLDNTPMSGPGAPSHSGQVPEHGDFPIEDWGIQGYKKAWVQKYGPMAEAEEALDKVKSPKGFCGLRCWMPIMPFHPRSFKLSPERYHGHRFSWG